MRPLECLAWAILTFEGFRPGTKAWRHCNPGNLRFSKKAVSIKEGYAVFNSFASGWDALLWDLSCKARGKTSTGLGPHSTIMQLITVWAPAEDDNQPGTYARFVADFLKRSLNPTISTETTLGELVAMGEQS